MRVLQRWIAGIVALGLALTLPLAGPAAAEGDDTLTLTVYPRVSHEKILGLVIPWGEPETITVSNYRIADLRGETRDHVLLETSAGTTRLKFSDIRRIDYVSYPKLQQHSERMDSVIYTVRATVFLTDGTRLENAIINAQIGTVEGDTELGDFFLEDPLTLSSITFDAH